VRSSHRTRQISILGQSDHRLSDLACGEEPPAVRWNDFFRERPAVLAPATGLTLAPSRMTRKIADRRFGDLTGWQHVAPAAESLAELTPHESC